MSRDSSSSSNNTLERWGQVLMAAGLLPDAVKL